MKFFDTNVLLSHLDVVKEEEFFFISSITLEELEEIKSSGRKSEEVRYAAREAVKWLEQNEKKYTAVLYDLAVEEILPSIVCVNNDVKIIACAKYVNDNFQPIVFISCDILARLIAQRIFFLNADNVKPVTSDEYTGFVEVTMNEEKMAYLYENMADNKYGCLINQYLIVKDSEGFAVDAMRWTQDGFVRVGNKPVKSAMFGDKIKAKDIYQLCAIDSIMNNTMTVLSGRAGSGKSLLSLVAIMNLIENGTYDRVIIMYNPTKARGASPSGWYKGSALDKAKQESIGSMLTTKFGDQYAVDLLLSQDKIRLISMADIRGMEVRDNEILYITECQNTSADLIKLCLSRASSGCKIIIEGDYKTQVDSYLFEGSANGMKRTIDVLKGEELFGYVELQNVWRSKIAALVDKL